MKRVRNWSTIKMKNSNTSKKWLFIEMKYQVTDVINIHRNPRPGDVCIWPTQRLTIKAKAAVTAQWSVWTDYASPSSRDLG
jgi:hypothetical protein